MEKHSRPLRILTIDDEEQIQYALKAVFECQGWEAISAGDVEEGLRKFRQHRPDLVVMDYHLPKINGVKGVRMLRKENTRVPLLVFTVEDNQEVADAFLEAGATDFILKPVKALDIISRIKLHIRLMESRQGNEELAKGIGRGTLELIVGCLKKARDPLPVETIAEETGLAYQTTYRYLQYMAANDMVEVSQKYGKIGRPKQKYRLTGTME